MIISIAGCTGSGKSTVAKMLAKKLGYTHYSIGDLRRKKAKDLGMTLAEFNALGETDASTDTEVDAYLEKLGKTEDNFVVDNRLAFHFISHAVTFFLDAKMEVRARRVFGDTREEEKYSSVEEAAKEMQKNEDSDVRRYQKYYGLNHLDKSNFQHVLDTTEMNQEETVEAIYVILQKEHDM